MALSLMTPGLRASYGNRGITGEGMNLEEAQDWFSQNAPQAQPTAQSGGLTGLQYFQQLHPEGSSLSPQELLAQEADLNAHGITLVKNAAGMPGKIQLADGSAYDVIRGMGAGTNIAQYLPIAGPGGVNLEQQQGGGFASGGPMSRLYNPNDLTAGWTEDFQAPTAEDAINSPGIQAALDMGRQAIERSAAAKGTLLTGGTSKDLTNYAIGLGLQGYGDVWNRRMAEHNLARDTFFTNQGNLFNRNYQLAGLGLNATGQMTNANNIYGSNVSDIMLGQGNVQGAGTVAQHNATSGMVGDTANAVLDAIYGRTPLNIPTTPPYVSTQRY